MLKVQAIQCPNCKDIIYSCAHHDFHSCSCGGVEVDGGFEYLRYGWNPDIQRPEPIEIEVDATKRELYDDWNYSIKNPRKYGTIKAGR